MTADYFVQANIAVPHLVRLFTGDKYSATSTEVNPLFREPASLAGLNPQLIFAGAGEFALQDSKEWAALCEKSGVKKELVIEWGQLHIWALGSSFIDPKLRRKTDLHIIRWIADCTGTQLD